MVDAIKRKFKIPARYVPYMEKHRVYELLFDLATQLVLKQPQDHILFLKKELHLSDDARDKPRLILLAPPHFNKTELAYLIAETTGAIPISCDMPLMQLDGILPDDHVQHVVKLLSEDNVRRTGWILYDYPHNREGAVELQRAGILPTHVIQVLLSQYEDSYLGPTLNPCDPQVDMIAVIEKYHKHLLGLREAYRATLMECDARDRSMEQLADVCTSLLRRMPHRGAPMLHRIIILGPRGSGRRTQAQLLCRRFSVVHVDMQVVVARARLEDSRLGERIHSLDQHNMPIFPDIMASLLERRILEQDCLDHGWVLTGYPNSVHELKLLNQMETPPNRVIYLNMDPEIARERITGRRVNMFTGERYHIERNPPIGKERQQAALHPLDDSVIVNAQVEQYQKELTALQEYCGTTATFIDGGMSVRVVSEMVQAAVFRPMLAKTPQNRHVRGLEWWQRMMQLCQDKLLPLLTRLAQIANMCQDEAILVVQNVIEQLLRVRGKVSEAEQVVQQIIEEILPGQKASEATLVVQEILEILLEQKLPESMLLGQDIIEEMLPGQENGSLSQENA